MILRNKLKAKLERVLQTFTRSICERNISQSNNIATNFEQISSKFANDKEVAHQQLDKTRTFLEKRQMQTKFANISP